jgi:hypothetical protein
MSGVCIECSQPAAELEIYHRGLLCFSRWLCSEHMADALAGARYWRQEFGALLDQGVSKAEANRIVIARMDAGETHG